MPRVCMVIDMNYNGFKCEKKNGIWTKCENGNIFTIIQISYCHYNCYFNDALSAENIKGFQNAIKHFGWPIDHKRGDLTQCHTADCVC